MTLNSHFTEKRTYTPDLTLFQHTKNIIYNKCSCVIITLKRHKESRALRGGGQSDRVERTWATEQDRPEIEPHLCYLLAPRPCR